MLLLGKGYNLYFEGQSQNSEILSTQESPGMSSEPVLMPKGQVSERRSRAFTKCVLSWKKG